MNEILLCAVEVAASCFCFLILFSFCNSHAGQSCFLLVDLSLAALRLKPVFEKKLAYEFGRNTSE